MPILIDNTSKVLKFELEPQTETQLNYSFNITFYDKMFNYQKHTNIIFGDVKINNINTKFYEFNREGNKAGIKGSEQNPTQLYTEHLDIIIPIKNPNVKNTISFSIRTNNPNKNDVTYIHCMLHISNFIDLLFNNFGELNLQAQAGRVKPKTNIVVEGNWYDSFINNFYKTDKLAKYNNELADGSIDDKIYFNQLLWYFKSYNLKKKKYKFNLNKKYLRNILFLYSFDKYYDANNADANAQGISGNLPNYNKKIYNSDQLSNFITDFETEISENLKEIPKNPSDTPFSSDEIKISDNFNTNIFKYIGWNNFFRISLILEPDLIQSLMRNKIKLNDINKEYEMLMAKKEKHLEENRKNAVIKQGLKYQKQSLDFYYKYNKRLIVTLRVIHSILVIIIFISIVVRIGNKFSK